MKKKWLLFGLLALIVVVLVVLKLFFVYTSDPVFEMRVEPMIGGGVTGIGQEFLVNSTGAVYSSINLGRFNITILDRHVPKDDVSKLRSSLDKAKIFDMESGHPSYGGSEWLITINGRQKTLDFISVPESLKVADVLFGEIAFPKGR